MNVNLDLPDIEDFELDEGKQPRPPKEGDHYYDFRTGKAVKCIGNWGPKSGTAIILRKKAPVYKRLDTRHVQYVEIEALEDALKIIEVQVLSRDEREAYNALKAIVR